MAERMMKAAVLTGPGRFEVKKVPVPQLKPGEIEIEVKACGVCGSDIHMWQAGKTWTGESGIIMGHEFAGIVADAGDSDFKVGDRVVYYATMYCGECEFCKAGMENLCTHVNGMNYTGFACNGGYAERFVGPAYQAYKIPDNLSFAVASLMDPFSVAYHAMQISRVKMNCRALVVGSGVIGIMLGSLLKRAGCKVVGLAYHNYRKVPTAKKIGDFTHYFNEKDHDVAKQIAQASDGGFDVVFECAGNEASYDFSLASVRTNGQIVLIGCPGGKVGFDLDYVCKHQIDILGSPGQTWKEVAETEDLLASDMFNGEDFITDYISLDELQHGFERQTSKTDPLVKIVVEP